LKNIRDVFICHASEDKDQIIRPMLEAFDKANISYWFDEAEIAWGDSITQKVNEGLSMSRYVLVIFSTFFTQKNWPQKELYAILNIEASTGETRVLPLLVGSSDDRQKILQKYPLMSDKKYLCWDNNPEEIIGALAARLSKTEIDERTRTNSEECFEVPIPTIKKDFTQRDKDKFLKESFQFIKRYFNKALSTFESQYSEIETEFEDIHQFKFLCIVYKNGSRVCKCKVWIGGLSADSIAYSEGNVDINNDNSYNEQLIVESNGLNLGLHALFNIGLSNQHYGEKELLSKEQAAQYLWERFLRPIS
jgi:hypothetical protein